ncbi:hypothetical protein XELAEV_18046702mg [Xenopus laevis]|uniref:Uncharacterized protein n=1 Tax=Xenopus laevis TaxID=8355 RepID=A0A974BU54_XENLA|nr:hypothetical protein XELAEV_18046702mg [Xenopus laevis]
MAQLQLCTIRQCNKCDYRPRDNGSASSVSPRRPLSLPSYSSSNPSSGVLCPQRPHRFTRTVPKACL